MAPIRWIVSFENNVGEITQYILSDRAVIHAVFVLFAKFHFDLKPD